MLTAKTYQNICCTAWSATREEGPFFCKSCGEQVILHKGPIIQHHFKHRVRKSCAHGSGESEEHYKAKKEIYIALCEHPSCSICELEYKIGDYIADVFCIIDDTPIAIEIQKSKISVEYAITKTDYYDSRGINTLWLVPNISLFKLAPKYGENICSISKWHTLLSSLYYGKIYIWAGAGCNIDVIHLDKYSTFTPHTSYFDEYGDECEGGGFWKELKRYREILRFPNGTINLAEDFHSVKRRLFKIKGWKLGIPACLIWLDNLGFWWK